MKGNYRLKEAIKYLRLIPNAETKKEYYAALDARRTQRFDHSNIPALWLV